MENYYCARARIDLEAHCTFSYVLACRAISGPSGSPRSRWPKDDRVRLFRSHVLSSVQSQSQSPHVLVLLVHNKAASLISD